MRDYLIVAYKDGATTMNRRSTGDWRNEHVAPGCVSLLTHAAQSHWRWSEDIEVTHLYLSPGTMAESLRKPMIVISMRSNCVTS